MTAARSATLLVNPTARGLRRGFDPSPVAAYLRRHDVETHVAVPDCAGSATREAAQAATRSDAFLFALGGDGTLRAAARGLAGSNTALAAVPAGTVNVWARETGIPRGLRASLAAHLGGQTVRVDLGRAGDDCFLLMAGVGWDAAVAAAVSSSLKRRLGDAAYLVQGGLMAPRLRARPASWRTGIVLHEAPLALMVLSNTRLYGGRVRFSPEARARDGLLDVAALCPVSAGDAFRLAWRLLRGRLATDGRVIAARVPELVFETPGFPVQLDGDPAGKTPMTFSVEPGALLVSVPAGPLPPLLG
ncbi:MAG: diacylglycerol kinase family lipid kinase [Dehalococcoidia bacterium]|nr:diacylglycerol kinase family lipid kinase [Dehalococcoidia bacterium]